jgi:hypothetical protein
LPERDNTGHSTVPDFESAKAYYWMKQVSAARAAGTEHRLPRRPTFKNTAYKDFYGHVEKRLSRRSYTVDIRIINGKVIRDGNV